MIRKLRTRLRLAMVVLLSLPLTGCGLLFDWGIDHGQKEQYRSTELVEFLFGDDPAPHRDAPVNLQLPIRVGLSFLPNMRSGSGVIPTASDKEKLLSQVRERFRDLPYIAEIVIIPDYYLANSIGNGRTGKGFDQAEQLARLFKLDLFALASYDQVVYSGENARALGYFTIVGQFLFEGETHEAHTVVDLAVIDPLSRSLVMRAGGTARFADNSTVADDWRSEIHVRRKSFEKASAALPDNLARELTAFEDRVRSGAAPVIVAKRGGGALDPAWLAALLSVAALACCVRSRGARASRRT
jgi:rhombotail lipoprotein